MPRLALSAIVIIVSGWAFAQPAAAQPTTIIHVKASAPPGGNGQSWATAFNDLQAGIAAAAAIPEATRNVRVFIAQGIYRPAPPNGSRTASFQLLKGTQYSGGYEGNPANPGNRSTTAFPTILSGDLNGDDSGNFNKSDNSYHVVTTTGTDQNCVLDLLTIRGGNADSVVGNDQYGGGILTANASPYLSRLTIVDNRARAGGGAFFSGVGPTAITVIGCSFKDNRSIGGASGVSSGGGGANIDNSVVNFNACVLEANSSTLRGGAVEIRNSVVEFSQSALSKNTAVIAGGAVNSEGSGWLTFVRCTLTGNSPGAINKGADLLRMHSCLVVGNFGEGAAVTTAGGSQSIGGYEFLSCTVAGNWGGGFRSQAFADSIPRIYHSVFWGNYSATDGSQEVGAQVSGTRSDNFRSCIVQNVPAQEDRPHYSGANPQFRISPTDPRTGNPSTWGDCRLLAASPCVDTGNNAESGNIFPYDLEGFPRFINGTINVNPNGPATIDRGCYEFNPSCPSCPNERLWYASLGGEWNIAANWVYGTPGPGSTARVPQQYGGPGQDVNVRWPMNFTQNTSLKRLIFDSAATTLDLNGYSLNLTDTQNSAFTLATYAFGLGDIVITEGRVVATGVSMAQAVNSTGRIVVSGPTASLSVTSQDLYIGYAGRGEMLVEGGARVFARSPSIGDQPTGSGSLRITGPGSRMDVPIVTTVNNGTITLENGGTIQSPFGTVLFQNGVLTGDGIATGTTVNFGLVQPRAMTGSGSTAAGTPGVLTIAGDYEQIGEVSDIEGSTGRLSVRLIPGSAGSFSTDRLSVGQSASLAGTLLVEGASAQSLTINTSVPILDAPTVSGRFDLAAFPGLASNRFMQLDYPPPGVRGGSVSVRVASLADNISLDPESTANVGGVPTDIVADDFNDDGFVDLALTVPATNNPATTPGTVVLLINAGTTGPQWNGFFTPSAQLTFTVGNDPRGLAVGDFNADMTPDLAVANAGSNSVTVLRNLNNGTGAMTVAQTMGVGTTPVALVTGVFRDNSNGAVDVAVANQGSDNVTILNNNSGILAIAATLAAGDEPSDIAAANLDTGSSTTDLAVTNRNDNTVTVYYRPLSGGFPSGPSRVLPVGLRPVHVEPGGLDNPKEINDLAVVNFGGGSISILLNNDLGGTNAGFQPKADLPCGTEPGSLALGRLDQDEDPDLSVVTTINGQKVVRVFRNDTQPLPGGGYQTAFAPFADVYGGTGPRLVIAADVNDDGRDDVVAVNDQTVTLRPAPGTKFANSAAAGRPGHEEVVERVIAAQPNVATTLSVVPMTPTPCVGDIVPGPDGDGLVNTNDLVAFLSQFGRTCAGITGLCADFDGTGAVDTADLVRFLGRFGQSCR